MRRRRAGSVALLALAAAALALAVAPRGAAAADQYEYDYGYGGGYGGDAYGYLDDYNNYYGNDDQAYYEEYGFYSDDDAFGYQDYYSDYYDYGATSGANATSALCSTDAAGRVVLPNGTAACDLRISGVDKQADRLPGGLDGVYKLAGCHDGRPMYKRAAAAGKGQAAADRVLYYAKSYADWDVSNGSAPSEDILLYGTDIAQHGVPLFVQSWQLGGDLTSGGGGGGGNASSSSDESYVPAKGIKVACADGKPVAPPTVAPASLRKVGPILTPDEIEAKYKRIFETYARRPEPNPNVNFSFVVMLVMVGLTIVLAIPYLLVRRGRKGYAPVSTTGGGSAGGGSGSGAASFAQAIQQSKKKQSGHIH